MTTYSHAQDAVRADHDITETGAGLLDAWAGLVEECVEGYDGHVTEYWNELRVRDRIESVLSAPSLKGFSEHGEFSARVHAIDARFRRIAAPDRSSSGRAVGGTGPYRGRLARRSSRPVGRTGSSGEQG